MYMYMYPLNTFYYNTKNIIRCIMYIAFLEHRINYKTTVYIFKVNY